MAIIKQDYGLLSGGGATLLWENSGTSVPSSPITINGLSKYTHLIFLCNSGDGNQEYWCMNTIDDTYPLITGDFLNSGNGYVVTRSYSISGDTITFNSSASYEWRIGSGSNWTQNVYAIPLKIYGMKLD